MTAQLSESLLERLAFLEHDRWSRWQRHLHNKCVRHDDGSLMIPAEYVRHLESQIERSYDALSEQEKDSDRKEARNTLTVLAELLSGM